MSKGISYRIRGWSKQDHGIVVLQRAYILENSERGFFALDAPTGWYGQLGFPFQITELDFDAFSKRISHRGSKEITSITTRGICVLYAKMYEESLVWLTTVDGKTQVQARIDGILPRYTGLTKKEE